MLQRSSMPVELIMTQGSRAGTAAPLQVGYYLVGRHPECQIRPKSRSVSRRHCLLLHNSDGIGVMDLESTGGTFVNDKQIKPHRWVVLRNDDLLRVGKVEFRLAFAADPAEQPPAQDQSNSENTEQADDRETPQSFEQFDVASFLDGEDQAEQDARYSAIRDKFQPESEEAAGNDAGKAAGGQDLFGEIEGDQEFGDTLVTAAGGSDAPAPSKQATGSATKPDAKKSKPRTKKSKPAKFKKAKSGSSFIANLSLGESGWKLPLAVVLLSASVLILGYHFYQSSQQGEVKVNVRSELD
ncbi:FHA domain-containing protein [Planctomycetes bacterium SV_7m_r]